MKTNRALAENLLNQITTDDGDLAGRVYALACIERFLEETFTAANESINKAAMAGIASERKRIAQLAIDNEKSIQDSVIDGDFETADKASIAIATLRLFVAEILK